VSLQALLVSTSEVDHDDFGGIKIVWRQRIDSPIKLRSVLADMLCHPGDAVVNAETGFYVVSPDESVIFISPSVEGKSGCQYYESVMRQYSHYFVSAGSPKVELVVLRGIAQSSEHSGALYEWASGVVAQACYDRRNVRVCYALFFEYLFLIIWQPNHDGSMVQLGWNAGPRHARVWGLAKSFNRKIDNATMIDRDEDAIALLTLCWSLAKASMPGEVIDVLDDSLKVSGMPRIATRNVPEGKIHNFYRLF
jgi:hypothetical protein